MTEYIVNNTSLVLLLTVFTPILGAVTLPIAGRFSKLLRNYMALAFVLVSFLLSASMFPAISAGHKLVLAMPMPFGLNFILNADALAVFMAVVSSLIGAIIVLFSFDYIDHYENQNEYYFMVVMFLGSMMGIIYSANLIFLYLFWEITAITSWRLIGFYRGKKDILKADKSFMVTFFGAVVMLIGFLMVLSQTGSFDLIPGSGIVLADIAVGLVLFGILSKSATLPFHTWLPDAGVAPSPVTALLHAAVLVKIGVYVFARLFILTFGMSYFWHVGVMIIAAVSALVAAGAALLETDLKRIIAYSTVSQIAFIFLGLATNSPIGILGALLYILMHGLAKGGLFLSAGIIEQNTGTKDITKLGGLIKTMPVTAVAFLFCAFSVMGVPPLGGFFSKYLVIAGAVDGGNGKLAFVFILGAVLTIVYLFRLFTMLFLGEAKVPGKEKTGLMVFSVALLAVLSLAAGFSVDYFAGFFKTALFPTIGMLK